MSWDSHAESSECHLRRDSQQNRRRRKGVRSHEHNMELPAEQQSIEGNRDLTAQDSSVSTSHRCPSRRRENAGKKPNVSVGVPTRPKRHRQQRQQVVGPSVESFSTSPIRHSIDQSEFNQDNKDQEPPSGRLAKVARRRRPQEPSTSEALAIQEATQGEPNNINRKEHHSIHSKSNCTQSEVTASDSQASSTVPVNMSTPSTRPTTSDDSAETPQESVRASVCCHLPRSSQHSSSTLGGDLNQYHVTSNPEVSNEPRVSSLTDTNAPQSRSSSEDFIAESSTERLACWLVDHDPGVVVR